ncbi:MAG: (Fe-S)-binding protein [candidate division Zixibacteria bacterium]|nr:(Fe-S)-binding protein [candidate division Zixibacteria bacterium]
MQTTNHKHIKEHEDQLLKCLKCGTCLYACPLYAELKYEPAAPRGRVALIDAAYKGKMDLSEVFRKKIAFCLNCKSCVDACPSGVRIDDLVLSARAELVDRGKLTFIERFIFRHLLKRGRLLPPVAKWATFMGRMAQRILPESAALKLFLPIPEGFKERIYPKIARKNARKRFPEIIKVKNPKMRVGYFIGCGTDLVYPEIAEAVIKVLTHNDIEVVIPKGWVCCGTSIYNSGDFKTGIKHAKKNLKLFNKYKLDAIVTNCASCGLTLKKEYPELLKAGKFDAPVYDINEFLTKVIKIKNDFKPVDYKVTYHDPCHLNRGQGIKAEPRILLRSIPGVKFTDMKEADRCCGGGGSFHLKYYPTSVGVMEKKLDNMENLDVDTLVTSCPGCMMRFEETFLQKNNGKKVKHIVELLAEAYGNKDKK